MSPFPTLETERLILRRFELSDAPVVHTLLDDPEVVGNIIHKSLPYSLADAEAMITQSHAAFDEGRAYVFAVVRKSNADLVGYCDLELEARSSQAEIAYWIGRPYWWQGYATEAAKCVAAFGFDVLDLERIYAFVLKRNRASTRVLQKAGLGLESTQQRSAHKDGIFEDVEIYSLLREVYADN